MKLGKAILLFLFCCLAGFAGRLAAQVTDGSQVTGPCTPFPCPAPLASMIDSFPHSFDTTLYNTSSIITGPNGTPQIYTYKGDTLVVHCGWIYTFNVEAGATYEWNTDISQGVVTPHGGNGLKTKITLFYDDYETSAIVSQSPVNTNIATLAAGLAWKANYTGVVGVMVTRGDDGLDVNEDYCACNGDDLLLRFDKLANPPTDYFFIWGRYGTSDTIPCNDTIQYIYDSGLGSLSNNATGDYANNENGYLVLHPDDQTAKLKLWGDSKLKEGDTLFIYNGDLSQNSNLIPYDTIVGQQQLGNIDNPIFMSQPAGSPITLRIQTDSSCTWDGLVLMAKCCLNPGLPTDLTGSMTSDTSALLTWNAAAGNEIVYNWSLFSVDSALISAGETYDTVVNVAGLNPNDCYFFTISVQSNCSMESGSDDEDLDVVYSNTFCYPYFVTLGDQIVTFGFNTDTLFVPEGAYVDSSNNVNVIIHESDMHVCYGQSAHICYNFPENVHLFREMTWRSSYPLDSVVPHPIDTFYVAGDTNTYVTSADTTDIADCFYTAPLYEDGYVMLDVWSEGFSLTRAILHIIVDSLPTVYITVNNQDVTDYTACENSVIQFQANGATLYAWTDSLEQLPPINSIPQPISTLQTTFTQDNAYYVTGTNSFGCQGRDTIRTHVNLLPDLQYNSLDTICLGDSIWLHVSGIQNYTWVRKDTIRWDTTYVHYSSYMPRDALISAMRNTNSSDNLYRVKNSMNQTVVITSAQLYDNTYLDSILISSYLYCFGYMATDHNMVVNSVTMVSGHQDSLLVAPRISTDYVVSGTDTNGCTCRSAAVIHIEVLPHPTILSTHASDSVCAHDTVTLSATVLMDGNYSFRWMAEGDTTVLGTDTILHFIPDSSITLYFSMFHSNGCDTTVAFPIMVFPHPDIALHAFPDTLCPGQSTTLTMSGSGVTEWRWDDGTNITPRVVTPDADDSYYVQASDDHGCTVTDYVSLYIYPATQPELVSDDSICLGMHDTIALSGDAMHYYWLGNGLQYNDFGDSLFVAPTVTTHYAVAYDNEFGCWDTARFTVFVYAFPQPQITQDTTICRGDSVQLSASGGSFFLWNDVQNSTTSSIVVSPEDTTSYSVTVYDYWECSATAAVQVKVIPYFDLTITSSADSVCPNTMVYFTANGGEDYVWNGNSSLTSAQMSLLADSSMVVSLSASNSATHCSRTVFDTLLVFPPPDFHFVSARDTLCSGDTLTIHLVGDAASYLWSSGDSVATVVVAPTAPVTYTVTAYSALQCETTKSYSVEVNPLPLDFTIHVGNHLCYGDSLSVNASPVYNNVQYVWNYPNIPTNTYAFYYHPLLDIEQDYTDTLTLAVVDERGCQRVKDTLITVYATPRDSIFGSPFVCRGDTVHLHASGQHTYTWHQPIDVTQKHNDSVWHVPTEDQTYTLEVVNAHNCHTFLTKDVAMKEWPTVSINTNGQTHFCNNGSYTLTAMGAVDYQWSDGQTGQSIQIQPMSQTSYSVTGVDAYGCVGHHTVLLDVDTAPAISLQVFPLDTICALDTFTIHADGFFAHILWNTQDTTYSITRSDLLQSTTFTATAISDHEGIQCQTTASVLVKVYPVPQLNVVTNTNPVCANDTGVIVVSGADSYQWLPHPHLHAQEGPMAVIYPENSTENYVDTFIVQGFLNGFNCRSVLAIPFAVDSLPDLHIDLLASGVSVCLNDTVTLVARGGVNHYWYLADNPQVVIGTGPTLTVSPEQSTTYMLRGINVKGCIDTAYYTVNVNGHPPLTLAAADTAVCYGFPVQLTATSNATLFSWSHASTLDNSETGTPVALPLSTTTYRVTVTDAVTGCETVDSTTIVVHPSPVVTSNAPNAACEGGTFTILLDGAQQYMWFLGNADTMFHNGMSWQTLPQQVPESDYRVIGEDQYGCRDTLPIHVNVYPLPELDMLVSSPGFICNDGTQFLGITVQSNIGTTLYQWSSYPSDPSMSYSQNIAFVSPDTTTTYVIDGYYLIDGVVCHAYDTANIIVYPTPVVTASIYPEVPCDNIEVTLTASGASQYMWFLDNQLVATGTEVALMSFVGAQYVVAGTDSNHCISRDTILVNAVHEPPVDSIVGATSICAYTPTVLRTSGSNHCEWSPSAGLSNVSDSSVTVTISETTTFSVVVSNEHGCRDTLYYTLTVFPLPELVMPNDTVLCEEDEFTFRVSGATYYEWEDGSTNDFRTVYPSLNTTSYSVTGTNQYGCQSADSFQVTVYPAFDLHIVATRDTFCIEDNAVTLTAYGAGDNYLWSTGSTDSIITVYPTSTTIYTLTAFNTAAGCLSSISREIVRMENPVGQITCSQPFICLHDTAVLSIALAAGETVVWNTGGTAPSFVVSPPDTTLYTAVVTNDFGCQTLSTYQVNVLPIPQVDILQSDSVLCYGHTVTLTALGDADLYQWSTGEVGNSITITSVTDNNYSLTGYYSSFCHQSDTAHVTIHPLPQGFISGPSGYMCQGDSAVLQLSPNVNCVWLPAEDVVQSNGTTAIVKPAVTKPFTAVMTNSFGCVDSTHFMVYVYDPLPLQITPDTVICYGAGVDVTVSGSWNYLWNDGFEGNSQYVVPTQTTTYTVSSVDLNECVTSISTTITVQPDYVLELHHDKDTICVGDSVTLWYVGALDQHYWSTGSTAESITVSPLNDAVYSVWAYNLSTNCAKNAFDTIIVLQYPVFMLSTANLVCAGDTLAVRAFSDYAFDYEWSSVPDGSVISPYDSAVIWVSPQETTTYIYHATNHFCTLTDSVVVEVAPLPIISVGELMNETCMQGNGSVSVLAMSDYPPVSYYWSTGATGASTIQNLSAGIYSLTVTDALGCTSSLSGIEVVNIPPPEISVVSVLGAINGADGSIDIDVPSHYGSYSVEWFFNSMDNPLPQFSDNISINGLDSGYYYVMVTDDACSTVAQIEVHQLYFGQGNLYIPNTITPSNDDGINDYFQLYYYGTVLFKEVLIYNRWGELVFTSNNINFKWNGVVNGKVAYNNVYNVLLYYYDYRGTEHVIRSFLLVL